MSANPSQAFLIIIAAPILSNVPGQTIASITGLPCESLPLTAAVIASENVLLVINLISIFNDFSTSSTATPNES